MEMIDLAKVGVEAAASRAAAAISAGGAIIYPTDTIYGLGADALSDEAVERVYEIKGRHETKKIHCIVSDVAMARQFAVIDDRMERLERLLPKGKITFVAKKIAHFDTGIVRYSDTFGFRIPDNEFCMTMLRELGGPITATSANASGAASPRRIPDIISQIEMKSSYISLAIDAGEIPSRAPSTVIDVSGQNPRIIREAAVSKEDLRDAIISAGWQGFDS